MSRENWGNIYHDHVQGKLGKHFPAHIHHRKYPGQDDKHHDQIYADVIFYGPLAEFFHEAVIGYLLLVNGYSNLIIASQGLAGKLGGPKAGKLSAFRFPSFLAS